MIDALALLVGTILLWGQWLQNQIGDAGLVLLIGPLLGLVYYYTFRKG